jgi:hypothetical protein
MAEEPSRTALIRNRKSPKQKGAGTVSRLYCFASAIGASTNIIMNRSKPERGLAASSMACEFVRKSRRQDRLTFAAILC